MSLISDHNSIFLQVTILLLVFLSIKGMLALSKRAVRSRVVQFFVGTFKTVLKTTFFVVTYSKWLFRSRYHCVTFPLRSPKEDNKIGLRYMIQSNLHERPPVATTSHKRPSTQNTKIFSVKALQLVPLLNDHLM